MCVIAVSEKGCKQPTKETLQTCFRNNPHGAGYMFARDGIVTIHKGFMTFEDFWQAVKSEHFTPADPVVYHFRISTQAGVNPEMTHPFPLSRNLNHMKALDLTCSVGIAHNGIIPCTTERNSEYSDTVLYIARYLGKLIRDPVVDLADPYITDLIELTTGNSRMAILNAAGTILRTGTGWVRDDREVAYSNHSYENHVYVRPATGFTAVAR
jgi:hypothetical protein